MFPAALARQGAMVASTAVTTHDWAVNVCATGKRFHLLFSYLQSHARAVDSSHGQACQRTANLRSAESSSKPHVD